MKGFMKKQRGLDEATLDRLMGAYRVSVDSGELAIDAMVRAARRRAVGLKDEWSESGFFSLVAQVLGFRRASGAMWSAAAGMAFALVIGVSLGAADILPASGAGAETAYSIDFDSVIGSNALTSETAADQDL